MSGLSERTTFGRKPERGSHERDVFDAVVDAGRVGHMAYVVDGQPYVLPLAYGRDGNSLLFHGSSGARPFRVLASGAACCFSVTHLDGLVLARSANDSSMNYRSAVVIGTCEEISASDAKERALNVITDHLLPGRRGSLRPMHRREVAATIVLRLPIAEFSVKSRSGGPADEGEDVHWPVWAGVMPIAKRFGDPVPAANLDEGIEIPSMLRSWEA